MSGKVSKILIKELDNIPVEADIFEIEPMEVNELPKKESNDSTIDKSNKSENDTSSEKGSLISNDDLTLLNKHSLNETILSHNESKIERNLEESEFVFPDTPYVKTGISMVQSMIFEQMKFIQSEKAVLSTFNEVSFIDLIISKYFSSVI